jgi:hypothetical protein
MINIIYKKSRISLHKKSSDYLDSKKNTSKNMANNIGNCHVENTSLYSFDFTITVIDCKDEKTYYHYNKH